jgi:Uma2 family endonuclease
MERKFQFYNRYGVEEYYLYDTDNHLLNGWIRKAGNLTEIETINGWISPRLQIKFELSEEEFAVYRPNGVNFVSSTKSKAS